MSVNDETKLNLDSSDEIQAAPRHRPGPGRPTPELLEVRNKELLERAFDLFLENGFERTTIKDIGSSIGMTKRTVYRWYQDKATLFKAALEHAIDEWIVPIERLRELETEDFEESLFKIARILVKNAIGPAGLRLMRITRAETHHMPEAGAYTDEYGTRPTIAYLTDLFRRRLKLGTDIMPNAEIFALAFLSLVVGTPARTKSWGTHIDDVTIDNDTKLYVNLFLHGLYQAAVKQVQVGEISKAGV